jgi:hypothetical protein
MANGLPCGYCISIKERASGAKTEKPALLAHFPDVLRFFSSPHLTAHKPSNQFLLLNS